MTHTTLKSLFTAIADAIRGKDGTTAPIVADEFPGRIAAIPTQGTMVEDILISGDGAIDTYANDRIKDIRIGALRDVEVKNVIFGSVENVKMDVLSQSKFTKISLKSAITLGERCMEACSWLEIVDMNGHGGRIASTALTECRAVKALALRDNDPDNLCYLVTNTSPQLLAGSNDTAYVYVPRALVENYKVYSGWAYHADRIRALEDYTVDGTITGDLDETKI